MPATGSASEILSTYTQPRTLHLLWLVYALELGFPLEGLELKLCLLGKAEVRTPLMTATCLEACIL